MVYTPWENLNKRQDMDVGTIGYHDQSRRVVVKKVKKEREIAKRIEKTKSEDTAVDFKREKEQRDRQEIAEKKEKQRQAKKKADQDAKAKAAEKEMRSYDRIFNEESINKTVSAKPIEEDDFMGEGSDADADELAEEFADFL